MSINKLVLIESKRVSCYGLTVQVPTLKETHMDTFNIIHSVTDPQQLTFDKCHCYFDAVQLCRKRLMISTKLNPISLRSTPLHWLIVARLDGLDRSPKSTRLKTGSLKIWRMKNWKITSCSIYEKNQIVNCSRILMALVKNGESMSSTNTTSALLVGRYSVTC